MQTNDFFRFRKRKSVNMQEINLEFWIMDHTTEGAKGFLRRDTIRSRERSKQ